MQEETFDLYILKDETTPYKTYTYVIVDKLTKEAVIIDPACEQVKIQELIAHLALKLKCILLTHTHQDHIRAVSWLQKNFGVGVYLSETEAHFYDYYMPNMTLLKDQEQIHMGHTVITCLHTPGHSKGSMCYWIGHKLFTGDTIFIEGCGICTGAGSSAEEMYQSIQHLKKIMPSNTEIYPGHRYEALPGQTMTYLYEKNIYFILEDESDFISFRMRKNQNNLLNFK